MYEQLWGICSIPSFPLLLGPLRLRVVVPIMVPFFGQKELFNH